MIVTAWHCFDGSIDLTQPPKAWLQGAWQALRLAASGGEMKNDWAIAYLIDPSVVDGPAMPFALGNLNAGMQIRMAGYQRTDVTHDDTQWRQVKTLVKSRVTAAIGSNQIANSTRVPRGRCHAHSGG